MRGYMELWQATGAEDDGPERGRPSPSPTRATTASRTRSGRAIPYFDFWKQAYLLTAKWMTDTLTQTEGIDERTRHKADFMLRQMIAAMSPINNPMPIRK